MKCNQCTASMINGIFCHEAGCPNFVNVYTCAECGSEYSEIESVESCCQFEELTEES